MAVDDTIDDLLTLVEQLCTLEQIQAVLREARDRVEKKSLVRISGENKASVVHGNLRDALNHGRVDVLRVYDLVRDAEENGNQHIFYYRPRAAKAAELAPKLTIDAVGEALVGKNWKKKVPNVDAPEDDFAVADLRALPGKPNDWILKFYGLFKHEYTGPEKVINGKRYLPLEEDVRRHVLVVRWNHPNLLELRVDRDESRRRLEKRRELLWDALEAAFDRADLEYWDLGAAKANLIRLREEPENRKVYVCRDARIFDPNTDTRCSFEGHPTADDSLARKEVRDALRAFLAAGDECTHLSVKWLATDGRATPSRDLHTLMGDRTPYEVVFAGQCEAADVDYVTEKLRHFSRIG